MGFTGRQLEKKSKAVRMLQSKEILKRQVETGLASGAGTLQIKSRDPVYHITESFKSTFDLCGQHNAGLLAEKAGLTENDGKGSKEERKSKIEGTHVNKKEHNGKPDTKSGTEFKEYESSAEEKANGDFYRRFSEVAFNNGRLASAVLQNGGKTMFVSCIKRALGQPGTGNSMKNRLFSSSSVHTPVKNTSVSAIFNRHAKSAIGLVVDTLNTARETFSAFESLAEEGEEKQAPEINAEAIKKVYPFLTVSKDMERLTEYRQKLEELSRMEADSGSITERNEIAGQKAVLTAGITKTQGLITKKRQMRDRFFQQLQQLMDSARKAEEIFTAPNFAAEVEQELEDSMEQPEDNGDNKKKKKKQGN